PLHPPAGCRPVLLESLPPPPPPPPPGPPPRPATTPWAWIVACVALAIALTSSALWWRSVKLLERLEVEVAQLHTQRAGPATAADVSSPGAEASQPSSPPSATADQSKPIIVPVPYA